MRAFVSVVCLTLLLSSCLGNRKSRESGLPEADDGQRIEMLQGIWLDDDTEMPVMKVRGDSIWLSRSGVPFCFVLSVDTLLPRDTDHNALYIKSLGSQNFSFYTQSGDTIRLHKAGDAEVWDAGFAETLRQPTEVLKKDSVLTHGGKRYRGYVFINPSTKKVLVHEVTDEGLTVDNVYYDNVIHVCVYQGNQKLYSRDIVKEMFAGVVPESFLRVAILSDMDFIAVDASGYTYMADICSVPSSGMSSYRVAVHIDKEGNLSYSLKQ